MQFTYFFVLNDSGTIKSKTQGQWKLKKTEGGQHLELEKARGAKLCN